METQTVETQIIDTQAAETQTIESQAIELQTGNRVSRKLRSKKASELRSSAY
jgi:hypothetical protein